MDCQSCEALLIDLVYDELSPHAQAEARAHLDGCAQCRASLERLSMGKQLAEQLPLTAAPSALSQSLMRAAHAQAAKNEPKPSLWEALGAWLRRFAFSRQLAMGTLTVLVFAVGLFALPQLSRRPTATGGTVVSPESDGEAAPSAALQPAKPLDLTVDARTGRIHAKGERDESLRARAPLTAAKEAAPLAAAEPADEQQAGAAVAAIGPAEVAQAENAKAEPEAAAEGSVRPKDEGVQLAEKKADVAERAAAPSYAASEEAPRRLEDSTARVAEAAQPRARGDDKPAPQPTAAPAGLGGLARKEIGTRHAFAPPPPAAAPAAKSRAAAGSLDDMLDSFDAEPAPASPAAGAGLGSSGGGMPTLTKAKRASSISPATAYTDAMTSYRDHDYTAARAGFLQVAAATGDAAQRTSALLYAARSARALGNCAAAVTQYRMLVTSYATSNEARSALSEGVACYDQLGQPNEAQRLLTDARIAPALAAQANAVIAARQPSAAGKASAAPAAATPAKPVSRAAAAEAEPPSN